MFTFIPASRLHLIENELNSLIIARLHFAPAHRLLKVKQKTEQISRFE